MKLRKTDFRLIHSKTQLQKIWCVYCAINILMLFPLRLLTLIYEDPFDMPWFLGWLLPLLVFHVVLWYECKLNYLYIAVAIGFIVFAVYMLIKDKDIKLFLLSIVLSVFSSAVNLSWIIHGLEW